MTIEEMQERKKELGFSYEKLSELSGVPVGTVQKILGGITKTPRYETRMALEAALRTSSYLYTDDVEKAAMVREAVAVYGRKKQGEYTLDDYYALPEDQRVELIDGVFYEMLAPRSVHQLLCGEIFHRLMMHIRENKGKCIPLISPIDVQLDCDDRTMVEPDVVVLCDRNKLTEKVIYGAPDFVVEILSPSTRRKDISTKLMKYTQAGVREYWVVDPDKKKVVVYDIEHEELPVIYNFEDKVPVRIMGGDCRIDFAEIYDQISFMYEQDR